MASSLYMKIDELTEELKDDLKGVKLEKTFGFQRVTPEELNEIVQRIQNPTYNTKLYRGEMNQHVPCPPRPPALTCTKAQSERRPKPLHTPRTEQEVNRIFKRLQKTTTRSIQASKGKIKPSYELISEINRESEREKQIEHARDQKMKWLKRLRRPTTATKQKHFCWFCEDPKLSHYLGYDFSNDKMVSKDELEDIVQRVQTPTKASLGQDVPCPKRKDSLRRDTFSPNVPLISGLDRSKSVDEITNRLYTSRPFSSPSVVSFAERREFRNNVTRPTSSLARPSSAMTQSSTATENRPKSSTTQRSQPSPSSENKSKSSTGQSATSHRRPKSGLPPKRPMSSTQKKVN